ncbi:negative regulator of flagellin synthesis FlgM [Jeotgalibacillus terrae]|uniref:flagellar biosynthesis anti-sigma factor FlgM n=1 Tax=Jeotgalibacillus terrae TaxID=587735 RepID=UPI00195F05D8|nr:flagellar biosynthesis anti-sigma factor FlgM [Jeotgalibacillus terrae]MBM7577759.1 negative regulator of flagellin synthesis FlgM [Jeotgalibacillus terrae]
MKINPFHQNPINPYKRQEAKVEQTELQKQKKADKVEISSEAKEMQSLNKIQEGRQERIDQLKASVENGTYKPDATQTAENLLKFFRQN